MAREVSGDIITEIKELITAGYKDFYFADANFIGPRKKGRERTVRLLNMLRPLNITYGMETRTDDIDEDIAALLFESGMTSLLIGIESGSARLLDSVSKNSGEIEIERAIAFLRKAGIEPEIGFLMFLPDASLKDIEKNFDFLKRNNLLDRLDRTANLLCHRQIVFMGTSGYEKFEMQGRLEKNGFLGFEGNIKFADKKVETMSGLVIKVCHNVLKSMGNPESPIYYNNNNYSAKKETNDSLVNYFESTLKALK